MVICRFSRLDSSLHVALITNSDLRHLRNDKPDVLCITETWLKPITVNSLLTDDCHFSVYRTDRSAPAACGGGVCVITNNDTIKAIMIPLPSKYSQVELCTIDTLLNDLKLRLFVCYRSDPDALQYIKDLCACI